jgi:hypothetical protein
MIQLIQISPDSGHSGATLAPLSPPDEALIPEVSSSVGNDDQARFSSGASALKAAPWQRTK